MTDELRERIEAMKQAAKKAQKKCPGPWFVDSDDAEECGPHAHSGLFMVNSGRSGDDWDVARLCEATEAAHIAQCDPDSVLALIAEVERLERENAALQVRAKHYFAGLERIWRGLDLTMERQKGDVGKLQRVAHDYMDETKVPT